MTTVSRTLIDLVEDLEPAQLANMMHEAAFRQRLNVFVLRWDMGRHTSRHGYPNLVRALTMHVTGSAGTRSALEDSFLAIVREFGLESPMVNMRVPVATGTIEVDCVWPNERLCVKIDGSGHSRARTRREDAARDERLRQAGYRVIRFSVAMLERQRAEVARRLAGALSP